MRGVCIVRTALVVCAVRKLVFVRSCNVHLSFLEHEPRRRRAESIAARASECSCRRVNSPQLVSWHSHEVRASQVLALLLNSSGGSPGRNMLLTACPNCSVGVHNNVTATWSMITTWGPVESEFKGSAHAIQSAINTFNDLAIPASGARAN